MLFVTPLIRRDCGIVKYEVSKINSTQSFWALLILKHNFVSFFYGKSAQPVVQSVAVLHDWLSEWWEGVAQSLDTRRKTQMNIHELHNISHWNFTHIYHHSYISHVQHERPPWPPIWYNMFFLSQDLLPFLLESKGRVLHISSGAAHRHGGVVFYNLFSHVTGVSSQCFRGNRAENMPFSEGNVIFQPFIFRCELLVSGRVMLVFWGV